MQGWGWSAALPGLAGADGQMEHARVGWWASVRPTPSLPFSLLSLGGLIGAIGFKGGQQRRCFPLNTDAVSIPAGKSYGVSVDTLIKPLTQ
jgi:hypothetical protein